MQRSFYATALLAILAITTLAAHGEIRGPERGEFNRYPAHPAYNSAYRMNQVPGARGVEDAAIYNRGLQNGAGGGTVYYQQQAPAQPSYYPAPPPPQTPY